MSSKTDGVIVGVLTGLAVVLRAVGLNGGLWYDEIVTLVESVRPPLLDAVTRFGDVNNHPLYSLLAGVSVAAFGEHAWALRLPAAIFGAATIPVVYLLGRAVASEREAIAAALVLTVSYHHVWFSQNARGYSGLAFATALATWLLLRALEGPRPLRWVAYAVTVALGAYTHLTMVFVAIAHAAVVAARFALDRAPGLAWRAASTGFATAALITLMLYAPLAPDIYAFFSTPRLEAVEAASHGWAAREALRGLRVGLGLIGAAAALVLVAAGFLSYVRQQPTVAGLFAMPAVFVAAATLLVGSPTRPRFFFFLVGPLVLLLVRGTAVVGAWVSGAEASAGAPRWSKAASVLTAVLVVASAWSLPGGYRHPKQDFDGALAFVRSAATPADLVLTTGPAGYPYRRYYRTNWRDITSREEFDAARQHGRVWIVYTLPQHVDARLLTAIEEDCPPVRVFPGTVGGGDIIVCAAGQTGESSPQATAGRASQG